jgi:hypothetical protein
MMKQLRHKIFIIYYLFFCSCVSVGLSKKEIIHNPDVRFSTPNKPFQEVESETLDKVWRHIKNGNTISFLSDCNSEEDPDLEQIQKGIVSQINNYSIVKSNPLDISQRVGLHTIVDGNVDGVNSRIELLIFKKNSCTYIITYAGLTKSFDENQNEFILFVRKFEAP